MIKHTPGPWVFIGDVKSVGSKDPTDEYCAWVETGGGRKYRGSICSLQSAAHIGGIGHGEALANTRLIAAAPDLLAALEGILAHKPDYADHIWQAAEEAVVKAKAE
jgi:hypothetical protein